MLVRGAIKATRHLAFGVLVFAVDQLYYSAPAPSRRPWPHQLIIATQRSRKNHGVGVKVIVAKFA